MRIYMQAIKLFILMTILTGLVYPILITEIAQRVFPSQANGSILQRDGNNIGSSLLAQKFESARYFWPRPSSIDFNPIPSGATNLGPTSADLKKQIEDRKVKLSNAAPQEMLTASGSGLDPHISPKAAYFQVSRVIEARGIGNNGEKRLIALIDSLVEKRDFNLLGEPRVNVLKLNLALDRSEAEIGRE